MKKLTKVFACFAILLLASACSGSKVQDKAIDKLESGFKKFTEMKSFDYALDLKVESENVTGKFYGAVLGKEGLSVSLMMDITSSGIKADRFMEFYLKDDMMYTSLLGQKEKQAAGLSQLPDLSLDAEAMNFDREAVKKAFSEASIDGERVHLVLDKALYDESISNLGSASNSVATLDEIKNITFDIEFENDFMKKTTLTFEGIINEKEETVIMVLTFDNINKVDSISFPDDLDSYIESDSSILSGIEGL